MTSPIEIDLDAGIATVWLNRPDSRALYARGVSADAAEGIAAFLQKRPPAFPQSVAADFPTGLFG